MFKRDPIEFAKRVEEWFDSRTKEWWDAWFDGRDPDAFEKAKIEKAKAESQVHSQPSFVLNRTINTPISAEVQSQHDVTSMKDGSNDLKGSVVQLQSMSSGALTILLLMVASKQHSKSENSSFLNTVQATVNVLAKPSALTGSHLPLAA